MNESTKQEEATFCAELESSGFFDADELRDETADRLREAADELEATKAVGRRAAERRDALALELTAERKRVAELETELNAANEKNAGLVNLADALRQDRDLALRTSDERRRAIERRDAELLETRRQRDDFERIAREARFANWIWRVVGFIAGTTAVGIAWVS
ncbi:MAG: hypothetical protein J6K25_08615 [Thermoguttaceae bacterium]|nr:hypothetical protein [Thermoguttaceae bacterium]